MQTTPKPNFITDIIDADIQTQKYEGRVTTRFPPEPNGYLHIGHAKSICLNFGLGQKYGGTTHLRMDDTNPMKEDIEYIEAIKKDVAWLGFNWGQNLFYASDYYEQLYAFAVKLIELSKAYVCEQSQEEIRQHRGVKGKTIAAGGESPHRNRPIEENIKLFAEMRAGKYQSGELVLRAKIDMASPNFVLRDPVMYRILKEPHPRTGSAWCIYPMYDFAHCLSDSLEKITHSICTLEFENNRALYDWFLSALGAYRPQQIEFARLNLNYTVLSKRKLLTLVQGNHVSGWDDPRMPTISGLRRRGYTPEAIRDFCERIGVAKAGSVVDIALLEHCLREDLNKRATRVMVVLNPLLVTITNYPENEEEYLEAENNPEDASCGNRKIAFSQKLFIERDDFMVDPPKDYFRLAPGKEVRLKHAYYLTCTGFEKDEATGEIKNIFCTYDPKSKGGGTDDGRKVRGTIHFVSAKHSIDVSVRLFERLFKSESPEAAGTDFISDLNPDSMRVQSGCKAEPGLGSAKVGENFQFLRHGYFVLDADSRPGELVFNRSVSLKDSWTKQQKKIT